jgi:Peptidase family M28/PA domain
MMKVNPSACSRILIILLFFSILASCSVSRSAGTKKIGLAQITPELLKRNIDFLASDSLKGRNTPSPGLDTAAEYIARSFRDMGLMPVNGSYFQNFSLCYKSLGEDNHLMVLKNEKESKYQIKTDFMPFEITGDNDVEGELVFAGYGITAPEFQYDDYKNIDVKGKIVLVFRHEPREKGSSSRVFKGKEATKYSNLKEKVKNAHEHGAIGMLVVTEPLNYKSIRPRGFPWPSLSKNLPKDALPIGFCIDKQDSIPIVHVGEEVIKGLFGSLDSLKSLQHLIDSTFNPKSFILLKTAVSLKTSVKIKEKYNTKNVVGFLKGSEPSLQEQIVVIGAHYDHIGFLKEHKADTDYIFNGADDNASGTSGVMAIAKAMTSMKIKPKRSLLFILFAGEEKGLFGSGYYVRDPLFPLKNTVAMLNLDMISRNSPRSLEIIGAMQFPDLERIIKKENHETDFILLPKKMSGGSDHWNFYKKDIPSIFFFTGLHKDYHQVTDNPDKIDAQKAAQVARLAFLTAWYIANDNHRYKIVQIKEEN